jgi:hypothetical protein
MPSLLRSQPGQEIRPSVLMLSCLSAFTAPAWLGTSICELLSKHGDSFDHDLAVFGILFWGALSIVYALGLPYRLWRLPDAVEPDRIHNVRSRALWLSALVIALAATAFCIPFTLFEAKHLGGLHWLEPVLLLVLAPLGLLLSWRGFKRLCADLAQPNPQRNSLGIPAY